MKKIALISAIGIASLGFTACTDIPQPQEQYKAKPAPTSTAMKTRGQMVNYCRGMIAGEARTKPMYVTMGKVEVEPGVQPATKVYGSAYDKNYICQFDTQGEFVAVYPY